MSEITANGKRRTISLFVPLKISFNAENLQEKNLSVIEMRKLGIKKITTKWIQSNARVHVEMHLLNEFTFWLEILILI